MKYSNVIPAVLYAMDANEASKQIVTVVILSFCDHKVWGVVDFNPIGWFTIGADLR